MRGEKLTFPCRLAFPGESSSTSQGKFGLGNNDERRTQHCEMWDLKNKTNQADRRPGCGENLRGQSLVTGGTCGKGVGSKGQRVWPSILRGMFRFGCPKLLLGWTRAKMSKSVQHWKMVQGVLWRRFCKLIYFSFILSILTGLYVIPQNSKNKLLFSHVFLWEIKKFSKTTCIT